MKDNDDKAIQKRIQETFDKIYYGKVSVLECPYCSRDPLRFSYTFTQPDRYRIWLSCTFCGQEAHLILSGRPPGYVLTEFQKRDEEILRSLDEWWQNNEAQENQK